MRHRRVARSVKDMFLRLVMSAKKERSNAVEALYAGTVNLTTFRANMPITTIKALVKRSGTRCQ